MGGMEDDWGREREGEERRRWGKERVREDGGGGEEGWVVIREGEERGEGGRIELE